MKICYRYKQYLKYFTKHKNITLNWLYFCSNILIKSKYLLKIFSVYSINMICKDSPFEITLSRELKYSFILIQLVL